MTSRYAFYVSIVEKVSDVERIGIRTAAGRTPQSLRPENIVALGALIVALVGLPAFLVASVGNPLPHGIPNPSSVWTSFQLGEVPSRFVVGLLATLLWIVWAQAVISFLSHMSAVRRFREAPLPRTTSARIHRLIGKWVASATVCFMVISARGSSIGAVTPTPNVRAVDDASGSGPANFRSSSFGSSGSFGSLGSDGSLTSTATGGAPKLSPQLGSAPKAAVDVKHGLHRQPSVALEQTRPTTAARTYVMQPKDTMWDIAEQFYGDGSRSTEIADANPGIDPLVVPVGVTLQIPGDLPSVTASGVVPTEPATASVSGPADSHYEVQPHDSLWKIAQQETGDGGNWTILADANRGRVQSDGRTLCDPNIIQPGWDLVIPTADGTIADIPAQATPPPPVSSSVPPSVVPESTVPVSSVPASVVPVSSVPVSSVPVSVVPVSSVPVLTVPVSVVPVSSVPTSSVPASSTPSSTVPAPTSTMPASTTPASTVPAFVTATKASDPTPVSGPNSLPPAPSLPAPRTAPSTTRLADRTQESAPKTTIPTAAAPVHESKQLSEHSVPFAPALLCVAATSALFGLDRSRRRLLANRPQGHLYVPPSKRLRQCEQLLRAHMNPELLGSIDEVNRLLTATWDQGNSTRVRYVSALTLDPLNGAGKGVRKSAKLTAADPDVHVYLSKHALPPTMFTSTGENSWKRATDAPDFGAVQPRPFLRGLTCIGSTDGHRTAWVDVIGDGGLVVSGPLAFDVTLQAVLQLVCAPWLQSTTELIVWAPDSHELPERLVVARTTADLQACLSKPTKFVSERIIFSLGEVNEEISALLQDGLLPTVVFGPQFHAQAASSASSVNHPKTPHLATFKDGSGILSWADGDTLALSRVATSRTDLLQTLDLLAAIESPQTIPNDWSAGPINQRRRSSIEDVGDGLVGSSIRDFDDPDLGLRVDRALGGSAVEVRLLRGQPTAIVAGRRVDSPESIEFLALLVCSGGRLDIREVEKHLLVPSTTDLAANPTEELTRSPSAQSTAHSLQKVMAAIAALGNVGDRPLATIENVVQPVGVTRMVVLDADVSSDWTSFVQVAHLAVGDLKPTPNDRLRTLLEALLLVEGAPATATHPCTYGWFEGLGFRNEILATIADVASEAIALARTLEQDSVALRIAELATRANPYDRGVHRERHQLLLKRGDVETARNHESQFRTTLATLDLDA